MFRYQMAKTVSLYLTLLSEALPEEEGRTAEIGWCRRVHHFVSWHSSKALRHQDNKNISQEEHIFNSTCYLTTTWDTVFSKNSTKMFHWHHRAKHVYYLVGHFSLQCEGYGDNKACRKQNTARKTEDSDSNPLQKVKKNKNYEAALLLCLPVPQITSFTASPSISTLSGCGCVPKITAHSLPVLKQEHCTPGLPRATATQTTYWLTWWHFLFRHADSCQVPPVIAQQPICEEISLHFFNPHYSSKVTTPNLC